MRISFVAVVAAVGVFATQAAPSAFAQSAAQTAHWMSLQFHPPIVWAITGSAAASYAIVGLADDGHTSSLTRVVTTVDRQGEFGATAAVVNAEAYRGRRVRLRALIRADSADTGASTWLRIDADSGQLALDNNMTRPLVGTTGWTEQVTVMDVPPNATRIVYGLLLVGRGTVHSKELTLEAVQVPPAGQ